MPTNATRRTARGSGGAQRMPELTYENLLTQQAPSGPAWIDDMHRYYAAHGRYRAADLNRLLGRPEARTEGAAVVDFCRNGVAGKKTG